MQKKDGERYPVIKNPTPQIISLRLNMVLILNLKIKQNLKQMILKARSSRELNRKLFRKGFNLLTAAGYLSAEPEDIYSQIDKHIQSVLRTGQNRIEIQLEPETLGKLYLKLELENGKLSVHFSVDNHLVKEQLNRILFF